MVMVSILGEAAPQALPTQLDIVPLGKGVQTSGVVSGKMHDNRAGENKAKVMHKELWEALVRAMPRMRGPARRKEDKVYCVTLHIVGRRLFFTEDQKTHAKVPAVALAVLATKSRAYDASLKLKLQQRETADDLEAFSSSSEAGVESESESESESDEDEEMEEAVSPASAEEAVSPASAAAAASPATSQRRRQRGSGCSGGGGRRVRPRSADTAD
jgi:hypothetical protein